MPTIVAASDADWVRDQVRAALCGPGFEVIDVERGHLRLEESGGRLPHVPILILLDREADRFLARRSTADAMLVKPIDAGTLRRTVKNLLAAAETPSGPEEEVG